MIVPVWELEWHPLTQVYDYEYEQRSWTPSALAYTQGGRWAIENRMDVEMKETIVVLINGIREARRIQL